MGRQAVRQGVADWLTNRVLGLNAVYTSWPKIIPGTAFFSGTPGDASGAVAWLHLTTDNETRTALGGATGGKKRVDHILEIHVFFRSVQPGIQPGDDAALMAEIARDQILDDLKDAIRADRTAGTDAIWQWGERVSTASYGQLSQDGNGLVGMAVLRTEVTEFITS